MKRCKICEYDDNGNIIRTCIFCILKSIKGGNQVDISAENCNTNSKRK